MRVQFRKEGIPGLLTAARAALGPVLIAGQANSWNGFTLASLVLAALLSDIFDGVLARRWRCDTAAIRLFDSMADTAFYLCTAFALMSSQPEIWRSHSALIPGLLGLELLRFAFDFKKFGKPASYHTYLAKSWGLVLAMAVIAAFAWHRPDPLLVVALTLGIVCNLEGLAISLILPLWRKDVKTILVAWGLRKAMLADADNTGSAARAVKAEGVLRRRLLAVVTLMALAPAVRALAVEAGQTAYAGGTLANVQRGAIGVLDTSSPEHLVFRVNQPGNSTASGSAGGGYTEIAYGAIGSFRYYTEVAHHIGVLPAVAVALVKRRERKHFFSISFKDSSNVAQVAIFEVPKVDPPALLAILRARAPQACGKNAYNCGGGLK